jgi:predicted oxidoreductase
MAVYPSTLGTSVGLRADPDGRVLSEMGEPIPGLFVCGNDMASIMRGHYPGPGITLRASPRFRLSGGHGDKE